MMPSAPTAAAASDSGSTRSRRPGRVAGVDDHRQVRELLEHRHGHQVEREAVGGLERADAALAEHHVGVAFLEDVLGRHQQLVERRGQPALEQRRAPGAADLGEQRVVLHVARADLDHVGDLEHRLEVAHVHQLGDDRQAGLGLRLGEQPQPLLARAPGRRRGRCAACRRRRAAASRRRRARRARSAASARATRPCRDRRSARSDRPPTLRPSMSSTVRSPWRDLRGGELVGLEDRHHAVHARLALQPEALDADVLLDVADRADHGHARALAAVGERAGALDLL